MAIMPCIMKAIAIITLRVAGLTSIMMPNMKNKIPVINDTDIVANPAEKR
jgi:hypothetical protein